MGSKKYQSILEAYNSIYEVTTAPDPKLANNKPVNPQSAQIAKDLFAKPSAIAPAATPAKPTPTPPAAVKPATSPAAPVSPSPTPPAAPAVPQKTFQQELDDLRKASAQATMAGPSKEAQALMSTRTKNILGPEKLRAGIEGQERVEKMKSEIGMPKVETPAPAPAPKPQTPTPPPPPKSSAGLTKDQLKQYNQATSALQNPLTSGMARGKVKDTYGGLTPEQQKSFKDYLKTRPKSEQDLYKFLGEQQIGVPLKEPTDRAAKEQLQKMIPSGEKVHTFKSTLQKAHYEYQDVYDKVLEYLIGEGYTEEESKKIMVSSLKIN